MTTFTSLLSTLDQLAGFFLIGVFFRFGFALADAWMDGFVAWRQRRAGRRKPQ